MAPTRRRAGSTSHLDATREVILGRSAFAAVVGLLPVPLLDDLLSGAVRTTLLRRIADIRHVGADDGALAHIADGAAPTSASAAAGTARTVARFALRRTFRRAFSAMRVASRAEAVVGTFAVATLFDHYCVRHHVGAGIDATLARRLRETIERAISDARRGLARRGVDRATRAGSLALRAAPRALRGAARSVPVLGGRIGSEPGELVSPAQAARETVPAAGMLQRSIEGFAGVFADAGRAWVEELIAAFDARWTTTP